MKKNLLLVFVFVSTFGFSQQFLKKIYETNDYTIVELYTIRNGTNNSNITGVQNFLDGTGAYVEFFDSDLNNSLLNSSYSYANVPAINPHTENVCNANLSLSPYCNFGVCASEEYDYQYYLGSTAIQYQHQLRIKKFFEKGDTNNDGLYDCYKLTIHLPKKLVNGNIIPTSNIYCIISGYEANYICANGSAGCYISSPYLYFRFNGITWILQTTSPNGNPVTAIQDVCGSLSISEIENSNNKISIYPNPTNNFITIQNRQNSTENFEYKIVDLTGRIVKNGNSKFNEQINIESLTSGNYFVQIQTDNNQNFIQKLIKN